MNRFFKLLLACILAVSGMIMPALAEGGAEVEGDGNFIGVHVDFTTATDEELAEAAARIKEEQQSRITTVIGLSETELTLRRGGSKKLKATVTDLKEGVRAGRFQWKTSDKKIAAVSGGTVKGIGPGEATVTCTNVLSDGTEITAECRVCVTVPVSAVKAGEKTVELGIGQGFKRRLP